VNESDMEHAQEAIEEFHTRPAKKRRRTWWGHHLSFSGAKCHIKCITSSCKWNKTLQNFQEIVSWKICIRQIKLSNGIGQMELSCVGSNQNRTPTLGLRKLDPERGGKQGELAGTCTCLYIWSAHYARSARGWGLFDHQKRTVVRGCFPVVRGCFRWPFSLFVTFCYFFYCS
jgi:hypothetical protein